FERQAGSGDAGNSWFDCIHTTGDEKARTLSCGLSSAASIKLQVRLVLCKPGAKVLQLRVQRTRELNGTGGCEVLLLFSEKLEHVSEIFRSRKIKSAINIGGDGLVGDGFLQGFGEARCDFLAGKKFSDDADAL